MDVISSTFRQASDPIPEVTESKPKQAEDKSNPVAEWKDTETDLVATYQEATGHPFAAEYFNVKNIWDDNNGGFKPEITLIEKHLKELVSADKLENSTKSAKDYLKSIEKKVGLDQFERNTMKITKVAAYIKMRQEIEQASKDMEKIRSDRPR